MTIVPILFCSMELYLPYCHSLKEKRKIIRSASDRLRKRFKCSVSELDHQDLWQRSRLGIAAVSSSYTTLEQLSDKLQRESERLLGSDLTRWSFEILEHE